MTTLSLQIVVFRAVALLIIATVHGACACAIASALGDPGPRRDGRLTLNPAPHLDAIGAVAMVASGFGWSRPLQVTPTSLRPPLLGVFALTIGSALAVAIVAWAVSLLRPVLAVTLSDTGAPIADAFIRSFVEASLGFALVNLLPLPPLGGGYILDLLWPPAARTLRRYGLVVAILMLAVAIGGYPQQWLGPPVDAAARALLHGAGYELGSGAMP